jgi:hypothetical protein
MAADHITPDVGLLSGDDVTELFGWPVGLLDRIVELHDRAYRFEIEIGEWRLREAELRAAGPARSPTGQIETARCASLKAWLDMPAGTDDAMGRILRLTRRLEAALHGAPDDANLRAQLRQIDEMLRSERHRGIEARLREERNLVAWWLASSARLDYITGLPWDYLARYRWLPDPVLGMVPAFLQVARWRALTEAPGEMVDLARQLQPEAMRYPASEELSQLALTRFPSRIIEAAGSGDQDAAALAGQVLRLWQSDETQRFLLRETARRWPENLRHSPADQPVG